MSSRTPEEKRRAAINNRKRYLPLQLENTRRKLKALINEAKREGRIDLLTNEELYSKD